MSNRFKFISVICFLMCAALLLASCNTTGDGGKETKSTDAPATDASDAGDVSGGGERELAQIEDGKLNIVIGGGTEKLTAKPGEEVAVKIELKNNETLSSLKMILKYSSKLSVVTEKNGKGETEPKVTIEIADPDDYSVMTSTNLDESIHSLLINWLTAQDEVKGDTGYATVYFKVSEDAVAGDFLSIKADINPNDVFDYDQKNVDYKLINGGIDVVE